LKFSSIQYYTALHHRADLFISRDDVLIKKAAPSLPVISPEEFIELYL